MNFKEYMLLEMPHGVLSSGITFDFFLETPQWADNMMKLISQYKDSTEELLNVFYQFQYRQIFKKRFLQLDPLKQKELKNVLPIEFQKDMGI